LKEKQDFKKLAKLRDKADKYHARSKILAQKNEHKKAGIFEGKAQDLEKEIKKILDNLMLLSNKLKSEEVQFRKDGNRKEAEKLEIRVQSILDKIHELLELPDVPTAPSND